MFANWLTAISIKKIRCNYIYIYIYSNGFWHFQSNMKMYKKLNPNLLPRLHKGDKRFL